jgi:acetate kinase
MNIFVINSGSSSIKYQLIRMPEEKVICSGIVESIGSGNAHLTHKTFVRGEQVTNRSLPGADHAAGLKKWRAY